MTLFCPDPLLNAARRLIQDIGVQTDDAVEVIVLPRLEHTARALCSQLKAIEMLDAHNVRLADSETKEIYTSYEDLPPLPPEERDRLEQKFIALLAPDRVEDEGDEPRRLPEKPKTRH